MTARTSEDPHIQGHLLPMSAHAACLTRVGRVHSNRGPASFFRFAGQFPEKFRPRGVCNALGQTMMVNHPVHMQVFDTDHTEPVDDLPGLLMGEVISTEPSPFMDTRHDFTVLPTFRSAFSQLSMLALDFGQGFFFLAEKAGVTYFFTIAETSKRLQSHVNAYLSSNRVKSFRLALTRKADVPFARTATADSASLDLSLDLAVVDHLHTANLGEGHTLIKRETEATLREGEAIVAVFAFEARKPRFKSMFSDS